MPKIGLSVSLCVADIARGDIAIEEVSRLIAGTRCKDVDDWSSVIKDYQEEYWSEFPDQAKAILKQLIADGKVEQPRLENDNHHPLISHSRPSDYWVESEDEIVWSDAE